MHRPAKIAFRCLWLQILLDLAVLTVVIHYVGSLVDLRAIHVPFPYRAGLHLLSARARPAGDGFGDGHAPGLRCRGIDGGGTAAIHAGRSARGRSQHAGLVVLAWHLGFVGFISGTVWYLASRLAARAAAARRRVGGDQPPPGGGHRRAGAAHAPHHAPIEGPFRGHPRQRPAPLGRILRPHLGSRRGRDRADLRTL